MRALPLILCLAACAELPPLEDSVSPAALNAPFPKLVPLDPLLAQSAIPSRAEAAQGALQVRSDRLRRRAIPSPGTGDLAARARRLRERAEILRNL